jgi:hypothetical protein
LEDRRFGETIMADHVICLKCGDWRDITIRCTTCENRARQEELNSGRQEKLPFAQLVIQPTIAENAYPGKLSSPGVYTYSTKYGVQIPTGGKIKVEPILEFEDYVSVIVYDKDGIIQSIKNVHESEINGVPEKYPDTDPGNTKLMSIKFFPAGTTEI